jgi:hypothetical protein
MKKLIQFPDVRHLLFCCLAATAAIPGLAQTAESAGAVTPEDAAASSLGQTNIWVIAALALAMTAIVVALIYRKKPSAITG